jgi:hypothetical protein
MCLPSEQGGLMIASALFVHIVALWGFLCQPGLPGNGAESGGRFVEDHGQKLDWWKYAFVNVVDAAGKQTRWAWQPRRGDTMRVFLAEAPLCQCLGKDSLKINFIQHANSDWEWRGIGAFSSPGIDFLIQPGDEICVTYSDQDSKRFIEGHGPGWFGEGERAYVSWSDGPGGNFQIWAFQPRRGDTVRSILTKGPISHYLGKDSLAISVWRHADRPLAGIPEILGVDWDGRGAFGNPDTDYPIQGGDWIMVGPEWVVEWLMRQASNQAPLEWLLGHDLSRAISDIGDWVVSLFHHDAPPQPVTTNLH